MAAITYVSALLTRTSPGMSCMHWGASFTPLAELPHILDRLSLQDHQNTYHDHPDSQRQTLGNDRTPADGIVKAREVRAADKHRRHERQAAKRAKIGDPTAPPRKGSAGQAPITAP